VTYAQARAADVCSHPVDEDGLDEFERNGIMAAGDTTELRSAAQVVELLQGQMTELLDRALEVLESAYSCPEWLRYERTEPLTRRW